MPRAQFPSSMKGWFSAVASSMVGFIAGLAALEVLHKWFGP